MYRGVSYRNCYIKRGAQFVFEPDNPNAIWVEDAHEPIVPRELWDAAHRQMQRLQTRTHTVPHMLSGLLVCPSCGNTFNATTSRDGRGHQNTYYFCRTKRQVKDEYGNYRRTGRACPSRWLPLAKTDRLVWDAFLRLISAPEMVEQYLASTEAEKRRVRLRDTITHLEESATQIEAMMSRAREKLLTEILTDGEYLREREKLDTQLVGIQKRLTLERAALKSASTEAGRQVIQNLAVLKLGEKKMSRDQRSRLFHALVKRVVPKDPTLRVIHIDLYVQPSLASKERAKTPTTEPPDSSTVAVTMKLPVVEANA